MTNTDVVVDLYRAFGRADLPAILAHLDEGIVWTMPGPPEVMPFAGEHRGHAGVIGLFQTLVSTVAFEELTPHEFLADGDAVVVRGTARTRFLATDKVVAHEWLALYKLRGGKIIRYRVFEDTAALVAAAR